MTPGRQAPQRPGGAHGDMVDALAERLAVAQIATGRPQVDVAAALWNGAVEARPAAVVHCRSTEDVRHGVLVARAFGVPISVRGGGHDWAGRAIREGGLVLDLSGMREVCVQDGVAIAQGGSTSDDVAAAAAEDGLAAAVGTVGAVGIGGLTLGGGYGPLCGRLGLAADNLVGAELVLADGSIIRTDAEHHTDVFWALQGGGGNFGVVTTLEIALYPIAQVLVGSFVFPLSQAREVLVGYGEMASAAPDALTATASIIPGPAEEPVVAVSATWAGAPGAGREVMDRCAALGRPTSVEVSEMTPLAALRGLDGMFPNGAQYAVRSRDVAVLTPEVASRLLQAYGERRADGSFLNIHHFHGRATRRPLTASAFGRRDPHLMIEAIEATDPLSDWTRNTIDMLEPVALPGGYPNLLGPGDEARTAAAFGPNASRLRAVKKQYDPDGSFRAIALP